MAVTVKAWLKPFVVAGPGRACYAYIDAADASIIVTPSSAMRKTIRGVRFDTKHETVSEFDKYSYLPKCEPYLPARNCNILSRLCTKIGVPPQLRDAIIKEFKIVHDGIAPVTPVTPVALRSRPRPTSERVIVNGEMRTVFLTAANERRIVRYINGNRRYVKVNALG